ncbi:MULTISPECIES: type III secretion system invasion protein IagB [Citrobacter]|uniref:type III secretion system invasion protein IagB n=1 Tax=Citrobacter TaxID=544 RepID=UPI0019013170|nr:type III secretion system invasion protein IagB [Citrobacter sedlakii]EKX8504336.1 type III secretion system invasion protein IagB [Citrobacter sedlakii]MBJ9886681.1 type III secretion system invasion protein IagB [Citrobacter sedlakii]MCK8146146.1 type III secretion system invasion protein IagB [Citrobacter sedlakii]HCJ6320767.1 type III secretion system invasion protein IagB [Citrobacter sedlakii]HDX5341195.1 type III secretion system invasion protein IagB [Citrobacter sedlakii]
MKRIIFLLLIVSQSVFANCWDNAAHYYHVDPYLLYAIAKVESGMNPYAVGVNHDGTRDVGLMQINSSHFTELQRYGIDEYRLIAEPCTSIMVGASILSDMIKVYGNNWEAVGAYNAGLKKENYPQRMIYARKVWNKYQQLKKPYRG